MAREKYEDLLAKIEHDPLLRRELARQSPMWFFLLFLREHIAYALAPFHLDMFALSQENDPLQVIMAFRGSGKSTVMSLSLVLWSMLGNPQKKFILIVSKGRDQAKFHFDNIKRELKHNARLNKDLGPLHEDEDGGAYSLELPHLGTKIICVSSGKSIRGIRYGNHRPDLIILDDVEDGESVRTQGSRDRMYQWFVSEILPAGDENTKVVVLGNLLHKDSLLMRLKTDIDTKKRRGVFRAYPLLDDNGKILWPSKFKAKEIEKLRATIADEGAFEREYLLKTRPEHISYVPYFGEDDRLFKVAKEMEALKKKKKHKPKPNSLRGYAISAPIISPEWEAVPVLFEEILSK
jgi:hypothetical protein